MSRRGYAQPCEARERTAEHVDETTVVRREWEDLIDRLTVQAVRTGRAENHKGNLRYETERALLKQLRRRVMVGVRRIERTFCEPPRSEPMRAFDGGFVKRPTRDRYASKPRAKAA